MRIQLLYVPDCPLAEQVRTTVRECLRRIENPAEVEESEGAYPSPTLIIDDIDVATGLSPEFPSSGEAYCRLDTPTRTQIMAALRRE